MRRSPESYRLSKGFGTPRSLEADLARLAEEMIASGLLEAAQRPGVNELSACRSAPPLFLGRLIPPQVHEALDFVEFRAEFPSERDWRRRGRRTARRLSANRALGPSGAKFARPRHLARTSDPAVGTVRSTGGLPAGKISGTKPLVAAVVVRAPGRAGRLEVSKIPRGAVRRRLFPPASFEGCANWRRSRQ